MNKARRLAIAKIAIQLDALRCDLAEVVQAEQDAFDAIPESLQAGERAALMEEGLDSLQEVLDAIEEAADVLSGMS